jgi:hypothetical protein
VLALLLISPQLPIGQAEIQEPVTAADLHDYFEHQSPKGIGVAVDLLVVEKLARATISAFAKPMPGVNQQIALPSSKTIQAGFAVDSKTFKFEPTKHEVTCNIVVYLHVIGDPTSKIVTLTYAVSQEPFDVEVDQRSLTVALTPTGTTPISPGTETWEDDADKRLSRAGYPTRERFKEEVYYAFVSNVARGLVRSVVRSLPIPQPLAALGAIQPVIPIQASLQDDYLVVWSDKATVMVPECGEKPSPVPVSNASWRRRVGAPPPGSAYDELRPPIALYIAADPLLNWHSGVLKPAVMVSQTGGSTISWRFDVAIGLDNLLVELVPSPNGGTIESTAGLKLVGVVATWLNLPCGPLDLASVSIQGDASAHGSLSVWPDKVSRTVDSAYTVQATIDPHLGISTGGILAPIVGELGVWLIELGVIKIATTFSHRGNTVIWDAGRIDTTTIANFDPQLRVGTKSALILIFDKKSWRRKKPKRPSRPKRPASDSRSRH